MVYVATIILIVAMGLYVTHPGDDVLVTVIATTLGFLFGKATNGIKVGVGNDVPAQTDTHPPLESKRSRKKPTTEEQQ